MKSYRFFVYVALIGLFVFSGCASQVLKRCDGLVADPTILSCPEQVQGQYRKCEKAHDVYQGCVQPQ